MDQVVVWGASGHAQVVTEVIELVHEFEVVGYIDDVDPGRAGQAFEKAMVLGGRDALERAARSGVRHFIVAIGNCEARRAACRFGQSLGLDLINAIHPTAVVSRKARLSSGVVCAAAAVISVHANVGEGAIINTAASVDHGCVIAPYVHIAPGVRLAGDVSIGECTWIGIGSVVREKVHIGAGSFIGAGSLVIRDMPPDCKAYGSPATVRSSLARTDPPGM